MSGRFEADKAPYDLFEEWFTLAQDSEINDPNAMAIASVDKNGMPDVRMVLMKGYDERGFVFYTNTSSRKGGQLSAQQKAALCFHWKSLGRQIRVQGNVEQVSNEEADAYYNSRPKGSRIGAWASDQSAPLDSRATLEEKVKSLEERYKDTDTVPRPPHWTGFRIIPSRFEFWMDGPYRLHDRFEYLQDDNGQWIPQRLYP
jgi:pyridoxamine 5'-phosphate oxidase